MTTNTNELHAAIYTTQTLLKQAADVIEQNMNSLAEAHTRNGIIDDTEVQASIESDADLIAELRAAALPWDQRHKSTERPPKRAHKFTPEQVAAVRADLQGAMQAHGVDTQNSETVTQTFEGLPMRKLRTLLSEGWAVNGVSIQRQGLGGVPGRGAVTTGGMVLWWHETEGQAVPETNFGDMAAPVQPVREAVAGLHAVYFRNNWDGEGDLEYLLAYLSEKGEWTLHENGAPLIEFNGDEIIKTWPLTFESATQPAAQPAPVQEDVGIKGYAMALNEVALKLRNRYKNDLLSTPLWADFEKARNKFASSIAAPVQEPDELRHIGEQDCLLDFDEKAWRLLVENRGGCRCHISPPCGACSNPISEEEMNEVGYTFTTPPAAQPAVPEGWKLVPVVPTREMLEAGAGSKYEKRSGNVWRDMLAAAPEKGQQ